MRILDRLTSPDPCFSFEFFPPKTDEGVANLFRTLEDLVHLEPGFVSVTYGAGGSTRSRTVDAHGWHAGRDAADNACLTSPSDRVSR